MVICHSYVKLPEGIGCFKGKINENHLESGRKFHCRVGLPEGTDEPLTDSQWGLSQTRWRLKPIEANKFRTQAKNMKTWQKQQEHGCIQPEAGADGDRKSSAKKVLEPDENGEMWPKCGHDRARAGTNEVSRNVSNIKQQKTATNPQTMP